MEEVWRFIGSVSHEGMTVSDELVRCVTRLEGLGGLSVMRVCLMNGNRYERIDISY
jgi:hypothetical protein